MGAGLAGIGWSVGFVLMIFFCVVLHELGHSLTARRYGVRVPRILLLPIGGMAEFDRIPRQPSAEFLISIAGPAVNLALVALLWPLRSHAIDPNETGIPLAFSEIGNQLLYVNLVMGGFNLIPVFPMDGGRIFRSVLATRLTYLRATYWAAMVGKTLSIMGALIMVFLFQHYLGAILFGFIFMAADSEYRQVLRREEEAVYWAELARRVAGTGAGSSPGQWQGQPPPLIHGPN